MCAICGWLNTKNDLSEKKETFRDMLELMSCRGKDNTGFHFEKNIMLGHKRLAIVDLENRKSTYVLQRIYYCI